MPEAIAPGQAARAEVIAVQSVSAAARLSAARRFIGQFEPGTEVLLVGAARGSVDDLARAISLDTGATFGLHRLSYTQLAARLAIMELAARERTPTTALGHEAVATRATFEARGAGALDYFSPISHSPGFPKALARTLLELRLAALASRDLAGLPRSGTDLAALLDRVDILMSEAGAGDRAALFEAAARALASSLTAWPPMPLLLLDVPFESEIEARFLWALVQQMPQAMITVPAGDVSTLGRLESFGVQSRIIEPTVQNDLSQLAQYLFSKEPPPRRSRTGELIWFSAPGEDRECVEIARRILKEAKTGVRFDEIAIVIRSSRQYLGVLEHALGRAGVPAYFERGTRRPEPSGRAFLAMLNCAVENFSAKRFAEYLSLGQVPALDDTGQPPPASGDSRWVASGDDIFGVLSERAPDEPDTRAGEDDREQAVGDIDGAPSVIAGTLRAPWKWENLLVESAVIGGSARWARRLHGLAAEYKVKISELAADQPDS
ncbi:MAG TPA: hypothetical protein VJQ55_05090, partial [Candidatus Binatia bacterium]|nr:hypothetical protein [Candidatus Binatia bacterium]